VCGSIIQVKLAAIDLDLESYFRTFYMEIAYNLLNLCFVVISCIQNHRVSQHSVRHRTTSKHTNGNSASRFTGCC